MKRRLGRAFRRFESFLIARVNSPFWRFLAVILALVDMRREATAVVWGMAFSRNGDSRGALTALRRDVHRLEKGMIMRPRRLPFGKDYVGSAVASFAMLDARGQVPEADRSWAIHVLTLYFEITRDVSADWLIEARHVFLDSTEPAQEATLVPRPRAEAVASDISIGQLELLAQRRRSVRWFQDEDVDPEVVDRAILVAGQAPSACNRQNVRFHMTYGQTESAAILGTVGGTRGFGDQVPAVAVVIGRLAGYRYGFDRHAIFVDGGLASMGLLYALEAQGLSSCCINWPDVGGQYARLRQLVHLDDDEQVLMLVAIGRADETGLIPASTKRDIDALRTIGDGA